MNYHVFTHVDGRLAEQVYGGLPLLLLFRSKLLLNCRVQRLWMHALIAQVLLRLVIYRVYKMEHVDIICAELFLLEGLVLLYFIVVHHQRFLEARFDQELDLVLNELMNRLKIRVFQS